MMPDDLITTTHDYNYKHRINKNICGTHLVTILM